VRGRTTAGCFSPVPIAVSGLTSDSRSGSLGAASPSTRPMSSAPDATPAATLSRGATRTLTSSRGIGPSSVVSAAARPPAASGTQHAAEDDLSGFDAIWVTPGSPYPSATGAIAAVRAARERGIPFLGTCGGFQHALIEFARDVCGLDAGHAEYLPEDQGADPERFLIIPLACSLVGHEGAVRVEPGSLAERILGAERTIERYHCSFGLNPDYLDTLRAHGLRFSGRDDDGQVRIAELPGHPFFLGTLFQPELAGDGTRPHPIIRALAAAAAAHAAARAA
jgi:CTP synthase (UTP-ammonia lyase)